MERAAVTNSCSLTDSTAERTIRRHAHPACQADSEHNNDQGIAELAPTDVEIRQLIGKNPRGDDQDK